MNPAALIAVIKINLLRRPLWQADTVQECLGITRAKLVEMIQSGEVPWAWNIGLGHSRKELRILGLSIVELQSGPIRGIGSTRNFGLPEVAGLILPKTRETLRGRELQMLFQCNPDTIRHLHDAGELDRVPEKLDKHGPNSSPRYTKASLVRFLETRRIT
jgi:hypothetical protein